MEQWLPSEAHREKTEHFLFSLSYLNYYWIPLKQKKKRYRDKVFNRSYDGFPLECANALRLLMSGQLYVNSLALCRKLQVQVAASSFNTIRLVIRCGLEGGGGGLLPEKLGGGVQPASQNPYPIYNQNLRFSLPYLWPDQKFDTLTWPLNLHPVSDPL